ncbi:hypothetical protein LCGC14_1063080, partial [marine sediment metagenome]
LQTNLDILSLKRAGKQPIKTIKGIGSVGREVAEFAVSPEGIETPLGGISQSIRTRPEATALGIAGLAVGAIGIPLNLVKITKLTSLSKLKASKLTFIVEKPKPGFKKTPLSEVFPQKVKLGIDNKQVENFLKTEFTKQGGDFNKLTKIEQNFLVGQIKARIKNNPALFIPKTRQEALKRAGVKNLGDFTRARLEGEFPQLVLKEQLRRGDLTDLQKRTLGGISENLSKKRIVEAIKTGPTPIKPEQLLTPSQKAFILKQFERQLVAKNLELTPANKILLERINTKSELGRVRKAILEGRKPIRPEDFLTTFEKNNIIAQIKAQVRANPRLRLTTAQRIALERSETTSELNRVRKAIEKGSDDILPKDLISEFERKLIERQLGAQARAGEFKAFGKKQFQIQVVKPVIEIKSAQLTQTHKLALKRLRDAKQQQKIVQKQLPKIVTKKALVKEVSVEKPFQVPVSRLGGRGPEFEFQPSTTAQVNQELKLANKQIQLEGQRLRKAQTSRQSFVKNQQATLIRLQARQSQLNRLKVPLVSIERSQLLSQIQQQKQSVVQAQRFAQRGALQFESFFSAVAQVQGIAQPQRFAQRLSQRSGLALKKKPTLIPIPFKIPRTGLLKRTRKQIKKSKQAYNAFARPQGSKKLMKLNISPLSKSRAKDTMAWFVDNSLSATGTIKKTRGKIKQSRLGIPLNYGLNTRRKFREFKIRKGKPIFTKNRFIEFRARRLDTFREKRNIKLAGLVARKKAVARKRSKPFKFKRIK